MGGVSFLWAYRFVLYGLCLVFFFVVIPAQVNSSTEVADEAAGLYSLQTYSRYGNATDNFPTKNFTICFGEENRTIYIRIVAEDKNSNTEIANGGNVTWKLVEALSNGSEKTVPTFGESFKQANLETTINGTKLSYLENITLTNNGTKTLYKIITNISDSNGESTINESYFTLYKTDFCVRTEVNATLLTTGPYELLINYCTLDILVDENVTGRIIVTLHNESPVDTNTSVALDKYVTVDVEGVIMQEAVNLSLIVNYTDAEVTDKGLDESSLRIYKWGSWNLQDGSVDSTTKKVRFEINESVIANQSYRLGTYSVRGDPLASGGPGSGGGGGGGSGSGGGGGVANRTDPLIDSDDPSGEGTLEKPQGDAGTGTSGGDGDDTSSVVSEELRSIFSLINTISSRLTDPLFWKEAFLCILLLIIAIIEFIIIILQRKKIVELEKKQRTTRTSESSDTRRTNKKGRRRKKDAFLKEVEKEVGTVS